MALFSNIPGHISMVILADLLRHKESHAPAIVNRNKDSLSINTIYVHLQRLHAQKLLTSREETNSEHLGRTRKRRLFSVTPYGKKLYEAGLEVQQVTQRATQGIVKPKGAY